MSTIPERWYWYVKEWAYTGKAKVVQSRKGFFHRTQIYGVQVEKAIVLEHIFSKKQKLIKDWFDITFEDIGKIQMQVVP